VPDPIRHSWNPHILFEKKLNIVVLRKMSVLFILYHFNLQEHFLNITKEIARGEQIVAVCCPDMEKTAKKLSLQDRTY